MSSTIGQQRPDGQSVSACPASTGHRDLAHHAFASETAVGRRRITSTQYDPACSRTAWDRPLRVFGRRLG